MIRKLTFMEPSLRSLWFCSFVISNLLRTSTAAVNTTTSPTTRSNVTRNETKISPFSCKWDDLKFPIAYGPGIACALCILLGGFKLIVGFKYQRTTLFLMGFTSAAILTYFICLERSSLLLQYILLITAAVAIFAGILCTTIVFCGLFASGLIAGVCIGMAFLLGFSSLHAEYNTISIPLGVVITLSVIIAGAAVWWKRVFLIFSSSVFGGALIISGVDYFMEDFLLMIYSWKKIFLLKVYNEPCLFSWIILGMWPLLTIIGLLVQFLKTGKASPKPKKDLYNKRYAMGSPFYSAPDLDDIEMTELLQPQAAASQSNQRGNQAHSNSDKP